MAARSSEPLVSVIVPVYNAEATLKACLNSLVAQTLAGIEIIVVNDASTDASPEIIEGYAAVYSRIRVLENSANQNSFETRRRGFAAARGAYIAACDADDRLPRKALELLYETAQREKADLVHGRMDQFIGQRRFAFPQGSPFKVSNGHAFAEALLRLGRGWNVYGKLYHRSVVEKAWPDLPANKNLFLGDDLLFSFFFGLSAGRYAGCPEIVYHYRLHHDNFFKSEKWASHIADHFQVLALIKERLDRNDLPAEYDRLLKGLIRKIVAGVFANLPAGADLALARSLITEGLGAPYLAAIYGQGGIGHSGREHETEGPAAGPRRLFHKAALPGRLAVFGLVWLWQNGFYEFFICLRGALALARRKGVGYTLRKITD